MTCGSRCYLDADEVESDAVILATGFLPASTGFQKALPHVAKLPGIDQGRVWAPEDVLMRSAHLGERVFLLDEGVNCRGCGTAWKLAEDSHQVTPDPLIGKELQRSAASSPG